VAYMSKDGSGQMNRYGEAIGEFIPPLILSGMPLAEQLRASRPRSAQSARSPSAASAGRPTNDQHRARTSEFSARCRFPSGRPRCRSTAVHQPSDTS